MRTEKSEERKEDRTKEEYTGISVKMRLGEWICEKYTRDLSKNRPPQVEL